MTAPIVVGLTDSPAGRRALAWAAARAAAQGRPLTLTSVVGGAVGAFAERPIIDAATTASEDFLTVAAKDLVDAKLTVTTDIRVGDPVNELIDASKGADLLVIGSDARAGENRGAHGVRLTAGAQVPVVVVPDIPLRERRGVVVGVDGSDTSAAAIRFAAAEADRLNEPLIAVSVWTPVEFPPNPVLVTAEYLHGMQDQTEEVLAVSLAGLAQDYPDLVIERRIERGYPSHALRSVAKNASLLVVGSHGRGRLARFLLGSISFEVLSAPTSVTAVVR